MVDSVGGTQTYAYDGLNRQTSITPPGSAVATVTYDAAGNVGLSIILFCRDNR